MAPQVSGNSLAVLYFRNSSGSREDEYFRDGVTEDVIIELSKIGGLTMISLAAVRAYRDRPVTAIEAGRDLGAAFVLDGSLRKSKRRLRLSLEMVETRTGRTAWTERYDRQVEDIFEIQDEIARNIALNLKVVLTDAERRAIARVPTTKIEAYDLYLQGRQYFRQFRRKSIEYAREMFTRAIEIDAEYSGAYAGLADCFSYLYMFWDSDPRLLEEATRASSSALGLDESLAEAHVSRGVAASLAKDYDRADREFQAAIHLNPALFEAYYFYARGYYARGILDRAVYWFERAIEVRPEDYQSPALLGSALRGLGLKQESDAAYRKTVELAEKHLEVTPGDTRAIYFTAIALSQLGVERERARQLAERALAIDPEEPQVLYNVACVYALQGLPDKSLECLTRTVAHGDWWRGWMKNDPDLEILRGHPEFRALAEGPAPTT